MAFTKKSQNLNVLLLSMCFMVLFTAYGSFQSIVSTLYTELGYFNLGEIILICIYISFALGSILCKFIIQRIGHRKCMFISCFSYGILMWTGLIVSVCETSNHQFCKPNIIYTFCLIAAIITGLGASIIWVAQSGYINRISDEASKQKLFGLFFAIYFVSQIFSNIFTTFFLGKLSPSIYFIIIGSIGTIISFGFIFLKDPQISQNQQKQQSISSTIQKIKTYIISTENGGYIYSFYVFTGVTSGFYIAFLYKLINRSYIPSPDLNKADFIKDLVYHTGLVFFCLGSSQVLIGFIFNRFGSLFQYLKMCFYGVLITEIALITSLLIYFFKSYLLCYFCAILWGISDIILRTYTNVFISKEFKGELEAFIVYRVFNSMGFCLVVILNLILRSSGSDQYIIVLIIFSFQIVAIICSLNLKSNISQTLISTTVDKKTKGALEPLLED